MATVTVRSTYALDLETVQRLEDLAALWKTSKSGALRRAIRTVSEQTQAASNAKLDALKQLQQRLALDAEGVAAWCRDAERERQRASTHRLDRLSQ